MATKSEEYIPAITSVDACKHLPHCVLHLTRGGGNSLIISKLGRLNFFMPQQGFALLRFFV